MNKKTINIAVILGLITIAILVILANRLAHEQPVLSDTPPRFIRLPIEAHIRIPVQKCVEELKDYPNACDK